MFLLSLVAPALDPMFSLILQKRSSGLCALLQRLPLPLFCSWEDIECWRWHLNCLGNVVVVLDCQLDWLEKYLDDE